MPARGCSGVAIPATSPAVESPGLIFCWSVRHTCAPCRRRSPKRRNRTSRLINPRATPSPPPPPAGAQFPALFRRSCCAGSLQLSPRSFRSCGTSRRSLLPPRRSSGRSRQRTGRRRQPSGQREAERARARGLCDLVQRRLDCGAVGLAVHRLRARRRQRSAGRCGLSLHDPLGVPAALADDAPADRVKGSCSRPLLRPSRCGGRSGAAHTLHVFFF